MEIPSKTELLIKIINRLKQKEKVLKKTNDRLSYYRLIVFLTGVVSVFFAFFFISDLASIIAGIFSITLFVILVLLHNKLIKGIRRLEKWIYLKEVGLAKNQVDWENIPEFELPHDIKPTDIETDLNISGEKSLLQLINFAYTLKGKLKLRKFFVDQKLDAEAILKKQNIVKEIMIFNKFREKLFLTSHQSFGIENFDSQLTAVINNSNSTKYLKPLHLGLILLAAANVSLISLYLIGIIGNVWAFTTIAYVVLYYAGWNYIKSNYATANVIYDDIRKFGPIFRFISAFKFDSHKHLNELLAPITNKKTGPIGYIDKIKFALDLMELRKNPFVWVLIMLFFPVDYFIALNLEKFKSSIKEYLPKWLESFHSLEAYASMANFAVLNEDYTFPILSASNNTEPIIECKEIGHPLLAKDEKVLNDFIISRKGEINIITGSNMSGKSTFLRTIGINTVLAYSGCVVDAKYMKLNLLELFSCIKVSDSVTDGISYFYAEVKRLKLLLEKLKTSNNTVFYLIDEIYKGTNNVERIKGSEALLKYLHPHNAAGLVSTHDLELVKIEKSITNVLNYHFKEIVKNDQMYFDYKLHDGPCPTTNALKIMEFEGLPTK